MRNCLRFAGCLDGDQSLWKSEVLPVEAASCLKWLPHCGGKKDFAAMRFCQCGLGGWWVTAGNTKAACSLSVLPAGPDHARFSQQGGAPSVGLNWV